ncbi:ribonuclease X25 [Arctopsyche grandis]|uniref:ribonuclease X25 n=1 Tax=Arctopsyche grandis TaxID=121162 RepID=UPI00406DA40E
MRSAGGAAAAALYALVALSVADGADDNQAKSHEWDVLIFTQHWPATVCYQWMDKDSSHSCAFPSQKNTWTVHGIWPTKFGEMGPSFCNNSWKFDPTLIQPIEAHLDQYWINVEKDTPHYSFWGHEWSKHGTCAAVLPPLNNEMKYFAQGLLWLQLYSMSEILAKADITPNEISTFEPLHIYSVIKAAIGKNPSLHCALDAHSGKSYMFEIRICFNKSMELVDCDGIKLSGERSILRGDKLIHCDLTKPVEYPSVVPPIKQSIVSRLPLIEIYKLITWLRWFTL